MTSGVSPMTTQKDVTRILESTKSILESESSWIQGAMAMNSGMEEVDYLDESACKWCLTGAIRKAMHLARCHEVPAVEFPIMLVLNHNNIILFNEDPRTTHNDVMEILDKAITKSMFLEDHPISDINVWEI